MLPNESVRSDEGSAMSWLPSDPRAHRDRRTFATERGEGLPAFRTRRCAHCVSRTTFVLRDVDGSYSCLECGRAA